MEANVAVSALLSITFMVFIEISEAQASGCIWPKIVNGSLRKKDGEVLATKRPTAPPGTSTYVVCDKGYVLLGASLIFCDLLGFGEWKPSPGTCEEFQNNSSSTLKHELALWPSTVIPYSTRHFHPSLVPFLIYAISVVNGETCVSFEDIRNNDNNLEGVDYVDFVYDNSVNRCTSSSGRGHENRQTIRLSLGCFVNSTRLYFALFSTAGLVAEHRRPDRDHYVEIVWENIIDNAKYLFVKYDAVDPRLMSFPYDYNSVMHFTSSEYAKEPGLVTIRSKDRSVSEFGGNIPSEADYIKLASLYCGGTTTRGNNSLTTTVSLVTDKPNGFMTTTNNVIETIQTRNTGATNELEKTEEPGAGRITVTDEPSRSRRTRESESTLKPDGSGIEGNGSWITEDAEVTKKPGIFQTAVSSGRTNKVGVTSDYSQTTIFDEAVREEYNATKNTTTTTAGSDSAATREPGNSEETKGPWTTANVTDKPDAWSNRSFTNKSGMTTIPDNQRITSWNESTSGEPRATDRPGSSGTTNRNEITSRESAGTNVFRTTISGEESGVTMDLRTTESEITNKENSSRTTGSNSEPETTQSTTLQSGQSSAEQSWGTTEQPGQTSLASDRPRISTGKSDMTTTSESQPSFRSDASALWPNAEIPYSTQNLPPYFLEYLKFAIGVVNARTCVTYKDINGVFDRHYVDFTYDRRINRCAASFGKTPDDYQTIRLSLGCFVNTTRLFFTLLSTVGLPMEHRRPDRDDYVEIVWENIMEDAKFLFVKYDSADPSLVAFPYDFNSVMHFTSNEYAKEPGLITIRSKNPSVREFGGECPSDTDYQKMASLYCGGQVRQFYTWPTWLTTTTATTTTTTKAMPKLLFRASWNSWFY